MPPKVNISKLKTARQPVESIPQEETVSSVFFEKPGKNTKGKKTSSPKSNMATIGSESIPDEETVSSVKGKKKSPSSNRAIKGSITSSSSAASDISSDVGSSDVGTPNKANSKTSAISLESHELDLEHWEYLNILTPYNKSQDNFQSMLASLTRSDAHHDLKKVFNETAYKNTGIKRAFDSGIPKQATTSYHEGEAFAAIMLSVSDSQGNTFSCS
jgi:hypothetical protein